MSERTPRKERDIADHPSLKPQSFLRQIAALPLEEGVVVDPFMGSGSTIAAAEAVGISSIGIERHREYFEMSSEVIPKLAILESPGGIDNESIPFSVKFDSKPSAPFFRFSR